MSKIQTRIISRAQHTGAKKGSWKVLVGPDDRILGAAIVGGEAGDVMTILQVGIEMRMRYQQFENMVIAHPIWAEGLNTVWRDLEKK